MKIYLAIFTLFVVAITQSCSDSPTQSDGEVSEEKHFLEVKFENDTLKKAELFAFWGDQQIAVDVLPIENGVVRYEISKKCNKGVYRLILDNIPLDIVYDNEDISLSLDPAKGLEGLQVSKSEHNKRYFSFLADYSTVYDFETNNFDCDRLSQLEEKHTGPEFEETLVSGIIEFLVHSNPSCTNSGELSESLAPQVQNFFLDIPLSAELLASPYFLQQLNTCLLNLPTDQKESVSLVYSILQSKANLPAMRHFVNVSFWECGLMLKSERYLNPIFASTTEIEQGCVFLDSTAVFERFDLGAKIENDLDENDAVGEFEQHVYLIAKKGCVLSEEVENKFLTAFVENKSTSFEKMNIDLIDEETRLKYNLFGSPIVLVADNNKRLMSKWMGRNDCNLLLAEQ